MVDKKLPGISHQIEGFGKQPIYYRIDGTPYPLGQEGMMEWVQDFADTKTRMIGKTDLPWGGLVSTVWLGLDQNPWGVPPTIFESMLFGADGETDLDKDHYSTREEAKAGHDAMVKRHWEGYSPNQDRRLASKTRNPLLARPPS
jgi:hypothetical protein